jgi:Raf kinase inhibitor-like YbhB/YbcL family protein
MALMILKEAMVTENSVSETAKLEIISPVFRDGANIPPQYTCRGQNVNPPINILHAPAGTQSLTLVMHDPDAVGGDYLHWLVWDIPPSTESISVNGVPVGAIQGKNGSGQNSYTGPCPPKGTGTHHYIFDFYALDTTLDLPAESGIEDVIKAQKGHVLDHTALTGLFTAET